MKLAYGIFYTNDIEQISDFYQNVVGLEKAFGSKEFVVFKIGEAMLGIKSTESAREVPGHQTIIIEVPNVDVMYSVIKDAGVTIDKDISDEAWGRNFAILDPDSNKVEFFTKV